MWKSFFKPKPSPFILRKFYQDTSRDAETIPQVTGIDYLRDPRLNKGLAFTLEERQALRIHGLQPGRFKTQEEQVELCKLTVDSYKNNFSKYLYLTELCDRNEKLFFRLLTEHIDELLPIVYTPTVGLACQKFGLIYRRPRGLFITINDVGHCYDILKNWPEPNVKAIVVTDGERILGLGDLGAYGMGIPVGKLSLYTAFAGIKPHECLPVLLDVGTNNKQLLEDPLYVGLRETRITGKKYNSFVDEFMEACVKRYGQNVLIQFEDFGNHNAFRFLDQYRTKYCTFNDDIQGTASIVLAGIKASERITKMALSNNKFMFLGAGEAAIGIADLLVKAMENEGINKQEARDKIWMLDIDGLLAKERPEGHLDGHKILYAKEHEPSKNFLKMIHEVRPTILIGASATSGAFTSQVLRAMADYNERPVIFALSNPTNKSECTAEEAYQHTDGRCIFASGSPFPPVNYNNKLFKPGQGNNAYVFPGVALGVILSGLHHISDDLFLIAAQIVSSHVSNEDIESGSIYPRLKSIRKCSEDIALGILNYAYRNNLGGVYPEPKDKRQFIKRNQYNFQYESALPVTWRWPEQKKSLRPITVKLFDS